MQTPLPRDEDDSVSRFAGRQLGKYRLVGKLGEGGMGVVYEAEDETLKRSVALKLVMTRDRQSVARFMAEAQAAARLNHPNVVTIHDVGQIDGQPFLAMELVRGLSAAATLQTSGPMPWQVATRVILAACRGLAAAHKAGLIHRDLKPGNILLAKSGEVKLADFGLARSMSEAGRSMTALGTVLGTPEYMSPEQCSSDMLTPQSDLYSLGATYFALLAGRPPYVCDTPVQTMYAHCTLPVPDPRELVPEIPEPCIAVLKTAMARQPHERFTSATQMQQALTAILRGTESPTAVAVSSRAAASQEETINLQRSRHRRSRKQPEGGAGRENVARSPADHKFQGMVIGMVATILAIAAGIWISGSVSQTGTNATDQRTAATAGSGNSHNAGTLEVAAEIRATSPARGVPPRRSRVLPSAEPDSSTQWSGLLKLARSDGHLIPVGGDATGLVVVSVAISDDGRFLAARTVAQNRGRLMVWDVGSPDPLLDRQDSGYGLRGREPGIAEFLGSQLVDFSHDGHWLVTGQISSPRGDVEGWRVPFASGVLPRILACDGKVQTVICSPVDDRVVVAIQVKPATSANSVFEYRGWPAGEPRVSWEDRPHRTAVQALDFSANGSSLAVTNGSMARCFHDYRGTEILQLESRISCLAFSPLSETSQLAIGGAGLVEIVDPESNEVIHTLTARTDGVPDAVGALGFSPDGRWLFVGGGSFGRSDLKVYSTQDWSNGGSLPAESKLVSSLAVSPTVPLLVSASVEGDLRLWDLRPLVGQHWLGSR